MNVTAPELLKVNKLLKLTSLRESLMVRVFVYPEKEDLGRTGDQTEISMSRSKLSRMMFSKETSWTCICRLGGELEVPTLEGKAVLRIPAGTQPGKIFRLKDRGIKNLRGPDKGDLYVHVTVEVPVNMDKEQEDLLRKFDASLNSGGVNHHAPEKQGFFDKLSNLFK